jgi:hypothetical protein
MTKPYVPQDTIAQDLARYLFENQRTKFSYLTDLWPLPPHMKNAPDAMALALSRREQMKVNPFMRPKAVQRSTSSKEQSGLRPRC